MQAGISSELGNPEISKTPVEQSQL